MGQGSSGVRGRLRNSEVFSQGIGSRALGVWEDQDRQEVVMSYGNAQGPHGQDLWQKGTWN